MNPGHALDGFDPLASAGPAATAQDDPTKAVVRNILNSYTGFFDVFSELTQNALDATQAKARAGANTFKPKISVLIDIRNRRVRVVDNGIGMSIDEFKCCLRPNVTFKTGVGLRATRASVPPISRMGFHSFVCNRNAEVRPSQRT